MQDHPESAEIAITTSEHVINQFSRQLVKAHTRISALGFLQKTCKCKSELIQSRIIHEDMQVFKMLLSCDNRPCSPIFPEAKQFTVEGFGHMDEDYSFHAQELPPT